MGPTRFPYGQALGFANQFYTNKGVGGIAAGLQVAGTAGDISGQTAPDVTIGGLFYTNNTAALTITNFTLQDTGARASNYEGKIIRIFFLDTATQIANAGPLVLQGTDNLIGANNNIELMFSRGSWFETDRVRPNRTEVSIMVTNAQSSLNMDGVRVAVLNNTGSTTNVIIGLSNGQVGQEVTFMNIGSNAIQFRMQAGGATSSNMIMMNTNSLLITASGAWKFIKHTDLNWRALAIGSANWAAG